MYNPATKAGFAASFKVSAWLAVGLYQQYKKHLLLVEQVGRNTSCIMSSHHIFYSIVMHET